jgi:hypothetical protein
MFKECEDRGYRHLNLNLKPKDINTAVYDDIVDGVLPDFVMRDYRKPTAEVVRLRLFSRVSKQNDHSLLINKSR